MIVPLLGVETHMQTIYQSGGRGSPAPPALEGFKSTDSWTLLWAYWIRISWVDSRNLYFYSGDSDVKFDKPQSEGTLQGLWLTASIHIFLFAFILAMVCDYSFSKTPLVVKGTITLCTIKKEKRNQLCWLWCEGSIKIPSIGEMLKSEKNLSIEATWQNIFLFWPDQIYEINTLYSTF